MTEEAIAGAAGLIEAGAASKNPYMYTFAVAASGFPLHATDPGRAVDVCRRDCDCSGQRQSFQRVDSRPHISLVSRRRKPSLWRRSNHLALVIRNYHDSGNVTSVRTPLGVLSAFLDRIGRFDAAATIAGFSVSPLALGCGAALN